MSEGVKIVPINRHPADRLADVRARIRDLKAEEEALRLRFIEGEDALGDEFEVVVDKRRSERLDRKKLEKEMGRAFLRPFMTSVSMVVVKVKKRGEPNLDREVEDDDE